MKNQTNRNMKKSLRTLLGAVICIFAVFISCTPDGLDESSQAEFSLQMTTTDMNSATFSVNARNINHYAYLLYPATAAPKVDPIPSMVFKDGRKDRCPVGENQTIYIDGMSPMADYVLYIAAETAEDGYWEDVYKFNITTTEITDAFALLGISYDGYKLRMTLPEEVKERGNVVRYVAYDLPRYNDFRETLGVTDVDFLVNNGGVWFGEEGAEDPDRAAEILEMEINNDNIYAVDDNGNPIYEDGEQIINHYGIMPGEPIVFVAGEFTHTSDASELKEQGDWRDALYDFQNLGGGTSGGGALLTRALTPPDESYKFPMEDANWTGFHKRYTWKSKAPEKLDAKLNLEIVNVGSIDATIRVNPDPEIEEYAIFIVDELTCTSRLFPLLGIENDLDNQATRDMMQWFTTSYYGFESGAGVFNGPTEISATNFTSITPRNHYYVFAVGGSDATLAYQCFEIHDFNTIRKEHPKPVVKVKRIPAPDGVESPFKVWFNVKCTNKNALAGRYACNDIDSWVKQVNDGKPSSYLVGTLGAEFTSAALEAINSDEGLNMDFATIEGATMRLGVMLYNDELNPNDIDALDDDRKNPAIAEATTGYLPAQERVDNDYLNNGTLNGDWTLTAQAIGYEYLDDGTVIWSRNPETVKSKIHISSGVEYPEVLEDYVYGAYTNKSRSEVDALYASFKQEATAYNGRLRGQNRLLAFGFNDHYAEYESVNLNAFECFYNDKYDCYDAVTLLRDFGTKWYLEFGKDGKVTVPFNSKLLPPMSNCSYSTMHVMAINKDVGYYAEGTGGVTMNFPVTISEDNNTIIIHPLTVTGKVDKDENPIPFYMNALYIGNGTTRPPMKPLYVSELTLTRGWTEPEEEPKEEDKTGAEGETLSVQALTEVTPSELRTFTSFPVTGFIDSEVVDYKKVEYNVPDGDELMDRIREAGKKRTLRFTRTR